MRGVLNEVRNGCRSIEEAIVSVYGVDVSKYMSGVSHITALRRSPSNVVQTIDVSCKTSPRCDTDDFVLNMSRAHSSSIIQGMNTVREEMDVCIEPGVQGPFRIPLQRWRRDKREGKSDMRTTINILTTGRIVKHV